MLLTPLTAPNHSQQHGLLFRMIFVCEQLLLWGREQRDIDAWETGANEHCCSVRVVSSGSCWRVEID